MKLKMIKKLLISKNENEMGLEFTQILNKGGGGDKRVG